MTSSSPINSNSGAPPETHDSSSVMEGPDSLSPSSTQTTTISPSVSNKTSPPAPVPGAEPTPAQNPAALLTQTIPVIGTGKGQGTSPTSNLNLQSIPPPPKPGQIPSQPTTHTTTPPSTQPTHTQTQTQPPPSQQSLSHPPGYIQNPSISAPIDPFHKHSYPDGAARRYNYKYTTNSSTTPAFPVSGGSQPTATTTATAVASPNGVRGRWRWDDAPGGAGGRYEYVTDGREEDDEGSWTAAGIWRSTVDLAKTAGNKLAEVEEGVWRWVNQR
ncbi:hypothetical protein PAAG_08619 [Paracoccidioides lutzii Pb01]|uniref:Uncharacterized protein n=1 Tax=Paracoccidioides lutzii (strain ATCC MYA-826 / Pb01) TaxID=502779 RepID=C1HCX8_PARBA|nr:hypothetical protein PAAG_08619 [Paracoccidioides lutzii Pb01]EEH39350.1 hypothetical protein PAAG_08619 [Paracoccidioides lutzii Pb01]